jgi:hypothetical protein
VIRLVRLGRVLISLVLTCVFGSIGFVLYLLSYRDAQGNTSCHALEVVGTYLLIWPVLVVQRLGGASPTHYGTSWEPIKTVSWLFTVAYYYSLVSLVAFCVERRRSQRG